MLRLEADEKPSDKLRREWAESLADYMDAQGCSRKELQRRLKDRGVDVTLQTIGGWLRGEYSPRPHIQGHIGECLNSPAHRIFRVAS